MWPHREEEQRQELSRPFSVKAWALGGVLSERATQQSVPILQLKRQGLVSSGRGGVLDATAA